MNKYSLQSAKGIISCRNCMNSVLRVENSGEAFEVTYICTCGELVLVEHNAESLNTDNIKEACREEDKILCPVCRGALLRVGEKDIRSFSFKVRCKCGAIYDRVRKIEHRTRTIGSYASLEDERV